MTPRRVLFTNNTLSIRAGTELYVRDLAGALLARGHRPMAFSTILGDVADELRQNGVPVVSDLSALPQAPDIVHGHHHIETMMAMLHFPGTPAVSVCHGAAMWEETPPAFPRILRYVAVDCPTQERLEAAQVPRDHIVRILNFVDLNRFPVRAPLPARPLRAVVLSNEISESNVLPEIREACGRASLSVDVFGAASGHPLQDPGAVLGRYDVVFAKARSALEGLATGAAVVLCSAAGMGPMVTSVNVDRLRPLNFGMRCLTQPVTADAIVAALAHYNATDAQRVSATIRASASLDAAADRWASLYDEVIAEHASRGPDDIAAEGRAASAYLRTISDIFKAGFETKRELDKLRMSQKISTT